jgi:hypothetical protein
MRSLSLAVISAIVGALFISSGAAPVGQTINPEPARPAPAVHAKPVAARSRPEVRWSSRDLEDRDRDAALGVLLLLEMYKGRHGR